MNVLAAKAFFLFCESVTEEEMKAIPELYEYSDANATKFQVVLRGDTTKPLTLVKSFKWLAEQSQIDNATAFASTLPEPVEETQKDGMKTVSDRQNVENPQKKENSCSLSANQKTKHRRKLRLLENKHTKLRVQ